MKNYGMMVNLSPNQDRKLGTKSLNFSQVKARERSIADAAVPESPSKIAHITILLGRGLQVVGNNSLNAPLNASAFGEHSSASAENSDGIDPNYCCRGAVVRWRWILG